MTSIHLLKISRLEGLTDGIFAIAMTIMVLNLHVPTHIQTLDILPVIRQDLLINMIIYIGSFIILGTHWIAMNFQLGLLDRLNRQYLWANMFYLMIICVIPFSANLLGEYPESPHSIQFYACNLLLSSLGQLLILHTARYYDLNKKIYTATIYNATIGRIMLAPLLYGASLIMASTSPIGAFALLVAPTCMYIFPGKIDRYETHNVQE